MSLLQRNCFIRLFLCSATVVVLLSFWNQTGSAQEKTAADQPVATAAALTKELVEEKLAVAGKTLAAISAGAAKDSPEGLSRPVLQR